MKVLLKCFCFLVRGILSLRYKVEIRGRESLKPENLYKSGGVLFLPNHTAHIDPIILYTYLWPEFEMRPLVIEYVYRQKFIHRIMKMLGALPVPNLETSINELKVKKAEESLKEAVKGLEKKEAFLIYPSGRLKKGAKEILGGASGAHTLLSRVPDTNVVLIRTTGLWGSTFSRALEHRSPDLGKMFFKSLKILLKNGIFFCKRRKVLVEISTNPEGFPSKSSKMEMNRFLEAWYNRYSCDGNILEEEPLTFVSYSFYKKVYPVIEEKKKRKKGGLLQGISSEQKEKILQEIAHLAKVPVAKIEEEMNLALDLGMDSLDVASLSGYLADHFDIGDIYPEDIETVQDVLELSAGQKYSSRDSKEKDTESWPEELNRPELVSPEGKNILESYFLVCKKMGNHAACGDHLSGILSYNKMQKAVIALALSFRSIPKKHVGVLLPASSAAYMVVLAIMLAGKVPVMLNWTLGVKFLNDTLKQTDCSMVVSSWKFMEKLSYVQFGEMMTKIRFLEDIRREMSIKTKLQTLLLSHRSPNAILRKFGIQNIGYDDEAVILFTSGTEAIPKGVPLTHGNILSNERASLETLPVTKTDVVFGVLPTFHSFGLSVTGLFPILSGLRIAFYPDPTDSFALVHGIEKWKATVFAAPPSFLQSVIRLGKKEQLSSLKLLISGAEKPSRRFVEELQQLEPEAYFMQGYGITECSPVVAMNEIKKPLIGVGKPISCLSCHTVHPDTKEPLKKGEPGEICVAGPSVFSGYLDKTIDPFINFSGKRWYLTGDLGKIDEEGNIILLGRLKRFAKIGGEMVSLGAVEEAIRNHEEPSDKPAFAISSVEKEGKAYLVLFTTRDLDIHTANAILRSSGYSRLVKIQIIHKLEEIFLTGTGKIDYRKLQAISDEACIA